MAKKKKTTKAVAKKPTLLTAAQIKKDCPADVEQRGRQIVGHYKTARQYENKADQQMNSIAQYLAKARAACNDGGFAAFRERFCPDIGRSKVYELLQIGGGKKTVEEVKAESRGRKAKQRAKEKAEGKSSVTVPDEIKKLILSGKPSSNEVDPAAIAREQRKAIEAETLSLPGARRALAEGEADRLNRFFGGTPGMGLCPLVQPMLEKILDEGAQPLESLVKCVHGKCWIKEYTDGIFGGEQGLASAILDQCADSGLVVPEDKSWKLGPAFRTGEALIFTPQYGEHSPLTVWAWTKEERTERGRQALKRMAIVQLKSEVNWAQDEAHINLRKAFGQGMSWFDGDIFNLPVEIFAGAVSSGHLRKVADLLMRIADEQSKATRH